MANELTIADKARASFLDPIAVDLETALPSTVDPRRFQSALIIAAQNEPKLFKCAPETVRNALMKCAADGLVPDGRQAALVPFYDNDKKCLCAQYIPMVQGIIARARELGEIYSITSNCVHANDEFVVDETDPNSMSHKRPKLGEPRGEVIGVYVIFRDRESRVIHREIMDRGEIDKARGVSKAQKSPAWNHWYGEMARKSVIRRGSKYVPMSDRLRQIIEREDEHVDFTLQERDRIAANGNPLLDLKANHQDDEQGSGAQSADETGHTPDIEMQGASETSATESRPRDSTESPSGHSKAPAASSTEPGATNSGGDAGSAAGPQDSGAQEGQAEASSLPSSWTGEYVKALRRATQLKSLHAFGEQFWKKVGWPTDEPSQNAAKAIYAAFEKHLRDKTPADDLANELREILGEGAAG
jgi:recombination protein RecT